MSQTASRELFTLVVLTIALGVAFGSAQLFDVSFALGAFFGGLILNESQLGHKAAADTLPLRDAFAVLFFVSVGMLFDPGIVMRRPVAVVATLLIIVIGKSLGAWFLVWMLGYPRRTALTISVSLAQIGEFAFMLAEMGVGTGLLSPEGRNLVLAGAILSIIINPFLFSALDRFEPQRDKAKRARQPPISMKDHVILIGHGRVGKLVSRALRDAGRPMVVIEENPAIIEELQAAGVSAILGRAETDGILESANVARARLLVSAIPNVFEAGQVVERAPGESIARYHRPRPFRRRRAASDTPRRRHSDYGRTRDCAKNDRLRPSRGCRSGSWAMSASDRQMLRATSWTVRATLLQPSLRFFSKAFRQAS